MSQNVEMSGAGSLTIAALVIAVTFLLRSFYKRYSRMDKLKDASLSDGSRDARDNGADETN